MENSTYSISGSFADPEIISDSRAQNDLISFEMGKKPISEQLARIYTAYREAANNAGGVV